jgi:hypothetical protein
MEIPRNPVSKAKKNAFRNPVSEANGNGNASETRFPRQMETEMPQKPGF